MSKLHIIKISPKSDMAIVWIDIWDTQNSNNVKKIINRYFNVESVIAMVRDTNINPGVSQYKNCWKWGHLAEVCRIQGSKCIKYNSPHMTELHCEFAWYCKANTKSNSPRLKTKKSNPYPHIFKYLNYKGSHLADSIKCPLWKYYFNKEWYSKEYTKLQEARRNTICSNMNKADL